MMATLHNKTFRIRLRQGLSANINTTATKNAAVTAEAHYTTDTKVLYLFDGTLNVPVTSTNPIATKTANYTLLPSDGLIVATGANSWTLDLSTIAAAGIGTFTLANEGTGTITVDAGASGLYKGSRYQYCYSNEKFIINCYGVNLFT